MKGRDEERERRGGEEEGRREGVGLRLLSLEGEKYFLDSWSLLEGESLLTKFFAEVDVTLLQQSKEPPHSRSRGLVNLHCEQDNMSVVT